MQAGLVIWTMEASPAPPLLDVLMGGSGAVTSESVSGGVLASLRESGSSFVSPSRFVGLALGGALLVVGLA